MKASHLFSFLCGAMLVLGISMVSRSKADTGSHVFELRVYHANEGKLEAVKQRFGNHTDAIFKTHNMKSIGYWVPEETATAKNLFVYVLEHPSRQEADKNWAAFQADPVWQKAKAASEVNGVLVDHVDRYFMNPTTYSAMK